MSRNELSSSQPYEELSSDVLVVGTLLCSAYFLFYFFSRVDLLTLILFSIHFHRQETPSSRLSLVAYESKIPETSSFFFFLLTTCINPRA